MKHQPLADDDRVKQLKQLPIFQNADLGIEQEKLVIQVAEKDLELFAQMILAIASLADTHGVQEVVLSAGGDKKPLSFPVSALEYYGMERKQKAGKPDASAVLDRIEIAS